MDKPSKLNANSILTGNASDFLKIGVNAAARGDLATLQEVLEERPTWRTRVGSHGRTMLWEAAYRGRLEIVDFLLTTFDDIDIEARGCHYTPLLVEISPLCAAILKKRKAVTTRLQDAGAQKDVVTATYLGELQNVTNFLNSEPSLVQKSFFQHDPHFDATLLHYAVAGNHTEIVRLLLELGAEVKPHSNHLLDFALDRSNAAILKLLLEADADATQKTYLLGDIDPPELAALLKQHGASIEIDATDNGWPSLVYVCRGDRGGNPDSVRELIRLGADVNVTNYKGQTALHTAAKAGFVEPVEILLAHGANVNAQDQNGDTPLHTACKSSIKDQSKLQNVVNLLTEANADLTIENNQGRTATQVKRRKSKIELPS